MELSEINARLAHYDRLIKDAGFTLKNPPPPDDPIRLVWKKRKLLLTLSANNGSGYKPPKAKKGSTVKRTFVAKKKKQRQPKKHMTPVATRPDFYVSPEWRTARYKALRQNSGKCELCGRSRHNDITLHVDHIKPRSLYPHLELDISNLQVLCEDCNLGKSNTDCIDWRMERL